MRLDLEKKADEYYKALIIYDAAEEQVAEAQKKIDTANARLARLQVRLSERMKVLYKSEGFNLLNILLDATSFKDFATKLDMLNRLNDADASLASQVRKLREQNDVNKRELDQRKEEALERLKNAQSIQEDALKESTELEELYASVSDDIESLIGTDQAAALAAGDDVKIIGNPRNIPPHPEVVEFARSRIGCPYVWAAAGPSTFDCSGLVVWVFDKAGIGGLPHYTESLYGLALAVGAVV
ncbi:MAG: C40 family peptidase, partial [Eggerthellaceae bacterium]|nr:C40 family peptidase [Eggerthellaceae bacterium]